MIFKVMNAIDQVKNQSNKLILLVGEHGTKKTDLLRQLARQDGYPYICLGIEASKALLELNSQQRAFQIDETLKQLIANAHGDVVLLDNIEVLFSPTLQVDPLKILQNVSRNTVVIASWAGAYDSILLTYAQPSSPEYRSYKEIEATIITQ